MRTPTHKRPLGARVQPTAASAELPVSNAGKLLGGGQRRLAPRRSARERGGRLSARLSRGAHGAVSARPDMMMSQNVIFILSLAVLALLRPSGAADEPEWQNWESDLTDSMDIGPTLEGYRRVGLRCAADHMLVEVEMEDDFDGVLYTRGAFHSQEKPCFLDARGGRNFTLSLPFTRCNTKNENNLYSNTIVIQYDDELIMPGDAAFTLECDFTKPKDYKVATDLKSERIHSSRIILDDADPAADGKPKSERMTAISDSDTVSFTPNRETKVLKDEL